jgi:hypothetical protein
MTFKKNFFLGLIISIFMLLVNLFTFYFDSNYIECKKLVRDNKLVKERISKIKRISFRLQSKDNNYCYYILRVHQYSKFYTPTFIYVEYDYINHSIVDLVFIENSNRCKYYGKVNEKYKCK